MKIKRRTMRREDWKRMVRREYQAQEFDVEGLRGASGLIHMVRVEPPMTVTVLGQNLTLVDDGYCWLQIAPEGENWWLTVMFDRDEKIVQYYFDMTMRNTVLNGGDSYFDDLFLDVVLVPGVGTVLLDEDELQAAWDEGVIGEEMYALARRTAVQIMEGLKANEDRLAQFCRSQFAELKRKMQEASDGV